MSDIELVIKIPKEQYSLIMQSHRSGIERFIDKEAMMYAIKNGTPLPKGHDRLIDAGYEVSSDGRTIDTVCGYMAPTIIEADKESEDK
jgi:hypothetical protein